MNSTLYPAPKPTKADKEFGDRRQILTNSLESASSPLPSEDDNMTRPIGESIILTGPEAETLRRHLPQRPTRHTAPPEDPPTEPTTPPPTRRGFLAGGLAILSLPILEQRADASPPAPPPAGVPPVLPFGQAQPMPEGVTLVRQQNQAGWFTTIVRHWASYADVEACRLCPLIRCHARDYEHTWCAVGVNVYVQNEDAALFSLGDCTNWQGWEGGDE